MRWRRDTVLAASRTLVRQFSDLTGRLPMKYPDRISTVVTTVHSLLGSFSRFTKPPVLCDITAHLGEYFPTFRKDVHLQVEWFETNNIIFISGKGTLFSVDATKAHRGVEA